MYANSDELLSPKEAASLLGVSRNTIDEIAKKNEIRFHRVGPSKWSIRIWRSEILRYLEINSFGREEPIPRMGPYGVPYVDQEHPPLPDLKHMKAQEVASKLKVCKKTAQRMKKREREEDDDDGDTLGVAAYPKKPKSPLTGHATVPN